MNKKKKRILVIGDLILDVYHHGRYLGKSVSDNITTVGLAESANYTWGGAGFLVRNILALGGSASFLSFVGKDEFTARVNSFTHPRLKKLFLQIPSRPTIVKERFWIANRNRFEWQYFDNSSLPNDLQHKIMRMFRSELRFVGKVIIADYRHGLLSPSLAKKMIQECSRAKIPLYVDAQIAYNKGNHDWYKGAYLFCLNRGEAKSADHRFDQKRLQLSLERLQKKLRTPHIIVKLGARGSAALFNNQYIEMQAHPVTAIDPTGAGDAFLGCLALGDTPLTAQDLRRANIWAALSTTMIGTEIPPLSKFQKLV